MTGPKRMRPESAEADSELAISYVVEPERRMSDNEKLHIRAENIVIDATGVEREKARAAIDAAGGSVKTAITMLLADCDAAEAARRLEKARGHVREAIRLEVL